ncbi:SDR family NAD(P)-dependent oxidoreductase [Marinomonas sp. 2405UD68-3]|uniref:SDR family NAD(P)-dependent oxidoreductase n=1 Tax=Marinomonas sp. 2405UD68-3 TaxID=3391835 RepID=UPI0039C97951
MSNKGLVIIAGVGTGLGQSLMATFQENGYTVIGLNRSLNETLEAFDIRQCDLANAQQTKDIISALITEFGTPKVVVHNTAQLVIQPFLHTTTDDFQSCWQSMTLSAVNLTHAVIPDMQEVNEGCFIVSGATASIRGGANFSAFASAKFALRGFTQSLAREFQTDGIHVVHAILDGIVDTENSRKLHTLHPDSMMEPNDIAQMYLQLSQQPQSIWTHELDLRPSSEKF